LSKPNGLTNFVRALTNGFYQNSAKPASWTNMACLPAGQPATYEFKKTPDQHCRRRSTPRRTILGGTPVLVRQLIELQIQAVEINSKYQFCHPVEDHPAGQKQ